MDDFIYNGVTSLTVRKIRNSYRWMLRHKRDIQLASITETSSHGAIVDLTVDDYTILRWHFGSCELATHMIGRFFHYRFYGYYPMDASNSTY